MVRPVRLGFALSLLAGLSLWAASASAHDLAPRACRDDGVLSHITAKFRHQVRHVPHLPDVEIVDFRRVHERRYLPWRENRPIARRYCGATAVLSDGRRRTIWYLIEDGMGFAGIGDGVEFCVSGFDRWKVYNGRCRVVR